MFSFFCAIFFPLYSALPSRALRRHRRCHVKFSASFLLKIFAFTVY